MVWHLGAINICDVLIFSLKKDTKLRSEQRPSISFESLQNCDHQYRSSFALRIFCVSFLNMSMALSLSAENAPPPQRIIAYECMNPKCAQSFSNMHSYDVHRYHASQCGEKSLRRDVLALTTAVIKRIPSKGNQCA
jgi:hypothetical protein